MTAPIRVALVTPYYPPSVGGLERYTHQEALALRDDPRFEVVVVTTSTGRRTSVTVEDGVTVVRLAPWVKVSNSPVSGWWPVQLRRLFARHRIDVVHLHAPTPGLADLAAYSSGRRPVVLTYHSGSMVKGVGGAVDALLRTYERHVLPRVMRRASELVAVSPVCSHLGCQVGFNRAERSWDCPCHGSRFAVDGSVLQGPAVHRLERKPL